MNVFDSVLDMSLDEFVRLAASPQPTPGGGSVAALAALTGCSMVAMAAAITAGKAGYEQYWDEAASIRDEAHSLMSLIKDDIQNDMDGYESYIKALRLSKDTPEERCRRQDKLEEAWERVCGVPVSLSRHALRVVELAARTAEIGVMAVISDVAVGAIMANGAIKSSSITLEANRASKGGRELATQAIAQVEDIAARAERLCQQAVQKVIARIDETM